MNALKVLERRYLLRQVDLPGGATPEDVRLVYLLAHRMTPLPKSD